MRKVIGIGETLLDIIFRDNQPTAAVPGGSVFNAIVSLSRTGVPVNFISETGNDRVGDIILRFMRDNRIPTDHVYILPNGKFSNAEYEVYLTNDQRPGRVTYRTTVIDEDGLGQDVTFTFELRRFMETPWEALDWRGSITDVSRNTNMDWDMGSFNGKRKDARKKRRRLTSKNVRYRDLPEKVRQHPGYIPGYTVTLPDGTVAYAEGEVELMDGQVPGIVSYWTNVSDDSGRCYDVAFTFDLGYFMSTPWEALDWSGSITDVIEDSDAGCHASRGIKSRRGRR